MEIELFLNGFTEFCEQKICNPKDYLNLEPPVWQTGVLSEH